LGKILSFSPINVKHRPSTPMNKVTEILDFWFGKPETSEYGKPRPVWFKSDPHFDDQIQERFGEVYQFAQSGLLEGWKQFPASCLALIITLDQFPRNLYRGTPAAFATDGMALEIAKYAVEIGIDRELWPVQRWFIYLPFEHSENLEDQTESLRLFTTLAADADSQQAISSARTHYELIQTYGRFPHRNPILNRASTPAEIEFLARPDSFQG
jgi:uncharacterized protein (DUF924 family)